MALRDFIHNLTKPKMQHNFVGAPSFRVKNPYVLDCYQSDDYASVYPSIKAISNEFMKIRPIAIGSNGEPLKKATALDALYHPNQLDSSVSFFEKLAVMNLTHRMTYVLVWRRQGGEAKAVGDVTPQNIAGYTFLENPAIDRRDGRTYYRMGAQEFSENEVIAIPGGVDPSGLYQGYAPGIASARWATLDEYIADFQKGFFENGAVPAGQFVITSVSKQDYEDTVDKLQESHRGAGKNNNVTYTPRPVDPNSGKPAEAKIEWIPYQQSNKDIGFDKLFDQANKRIDSTFGVPASIRGVGENNNYATARVDQQNFIRFTIEPLALRIYTQITHELNRITGGLGYAITFTLKYPAIADEEKVQAETKNVEVSALLKLTDKGFTLETAIDALQLSNSYKLLKMGESKETKIDNDKPDVDDGGEVSAAPDPDKIDGVSPLGAAKSPNPKAELSEQEKLEAAGRSMMQSQIDNAIRQYKETTEARAEVVAEPTNEELDLFVVAMMAVILGILSENGGEGYAAGVALLTEAQKELVTEFILTDTAEDGYRAYLRRVGQSYGGDTAESIRSVLNTSQAEGWTRVQTENALKDIIDVDDWRIKRLAVTELNRSQAIGQVEGMKQIQDQTGAVIEKSLHHPTGAQCEYCKSLEDVWVKVDQPLVGLGETIVGVDGGILVNDFAANEGYDPHPNGTGILIWRVA